MQKQTKHYPGWFVVLRKYILRNPRALIGREQRRFLQKLVALKELKRDPRGRRREIHVARIVIAADMAMLGMGGMVVAVMLRIFISMSSVVVVGSGKHRLPAEQQHQR